MPQSMYRLLLLIILFSFPGLSQALAQRATDTFKLYFDLNAPALSESMERKIDLLIFNDKLISGSNIMIVGYADYLGTETYNNNLSYKRAQNVKEYLVKYGMNANDITLCLGKGKIERAGMTAKSGFPTDRRVDIVVNNTPKRKEQLTAKHPTKTHKKDSVTRKPGVPNMEELTHMPTGATLILKNVYFPPDRHFIKPESYKTLEKLYTILRDNPKMKISIEGHVCCIRDVPDALDVDTYEPILSVNRAKEIYNFLVDKGIEASRLSYAGFGRRRPVVVEEMNEFDAEKNRRVEIRITENK
jgi:outer membrane protein OmpA-like peptidoglycan-associated protein